MAGKGVLAVGKKRGRPVDPSRDETAMRRIILLVSPEYDDWIEARAAQLRTTKSGAVDRMIAEWAESHGVDAPPQRV